MRDFRDAKAMAHTLRASLAAMDFKITHSQSLELIARSFGLPDWNALSAAIHAEPGPVPGNAPPPPPAAMPPPPVTESTSASDKKPKVLSSQLESTLNHAFAYARERGHEKITLEHLLLFLLDDPDAVPVIKACGVDSADLRRKLAGCIDNEFRDQAVDGGGNPQPALGFQRLRRWILRAQGSGNPLPTLGPLPALGFKRVLQRSVFHVKTAGRLPVTGANVLVAAFSEKDSYAVKLLNEQGMTRAEAISALSRPGP